MADNMLWSAGGMWQDWLPVKCFIENLKCSSRGSLHFFKEIRNRKKIQFKVSRSCLWIISSSWSAGLTWEGDRCPWCPSFCRDGSRTPRHLHLPPPWQWGPGTPSLSCRVCRGGPCSWRSGGNTCTGNTGDPLQSEHAAVILTTGTDKMTFH